jgi:hypothetical protein
LTINRDEAGRILQGFAPPDEFLQFIRALDEADALEGDVTNDLSTVIYLLEKPWKYAGEFVAWNEAGRPMDDSESGWSRFVEAIER